MKIVSIYTDGACSGNPGPGGWAALLLYLDKKKEISGCLPSTTNNIMELTAVIEALKCLRLTDIESWKIDVYTDSKYVCDGIASWIYSWQKNKWRTSKNQPVKNAELWRELFDLKQNKNISWHWVKGHADNELNNYVDSLARSAIKNLE